MILILKRNNKCLRLLGELATTLGHFAHVLFEQVLLGAEAVVLDVELPVDVAHVDVEHLVVHVAHLVDEREYVRVGEVPLGGREELERLDRLAQLGLNAHEERLAVRQSQVQVHHVRGQRLLEQMAHKLDRS